ncbi:MULTISPECIES: cytochrome P450 [unclassified Saccharopolyspora]|uniref:cytochrome P450 n=1 Tax=unclassified Saccharopolyspora TaxID=2646250 RepID=UPI001CD72CE2|nr:MULTISPECIES: cytochrome P450 [unclassified Saccharopolyspora]MCA1186228.1 cytochrome P450 [Saccharopolyspora sp. 6T]MCA1278430.1 cytochrome P450 [Saccharopolyspora sp. 7B]
MPQLLCLDAVSSGLLSWFAGRYRSVKQGSGVELSQLRYLPKSAKAVLQRDGVSPVPELTRGRSIKPVRRLPLPIGRSVWLVTGYAECKHVLGSSCGFSNDLGRVLGAESVSSSPGLGFADPPRHTRLRKLLQPEFTKRRIARIRPRVQEIIDEALDAAAAKSGPVDLVAEFAAVIPAAVICELLGMPRHDSERIQELSEARFDLSGRAQHSFNAMTDSLEYLRGVLAEQRRDPGDGLLGAVVRDHGDEVDDDELVGLADGLLTGGFETTASMIAIGALLMLRDPSIPQQLREDPGSANAFVEEALRYATVVQVAFPRFAEEDTVIGDVEISAGDVVLCSLSAADRDPALGEGMDEFDMARGRTAHLAFGHGIHRCIGAELGRMELERAYLSLANRFPRMRLAVPESELDFRQLSIVHGLISLPVWLF